MSHKNKASTGPTTRRSTPSQSRSNSVDRQLDTDPKTDSPTPYHPSADGNSEHFTMVNSQIAQLQVENLHIRSQLQAVITMLSQISIPFTRDEIKQESKLERTPTAQATPTVAETLAKTNPLSTGSTNSSTGSNNTIQSGLNENVIGNRITQSVTTNRLRLVTPLLKVKTLTDSPGLVTFKHWKEMVFMQFGQSSLSDYLEQNWNKLVLIYESKYPTVRTAELVDHIQTQSSMMYYTLCQYLGPNAQPLAQHIETKYTGTDSFVKKNVYLLWTELLLKFESSTGFSKIGLINAIQSVKFNINEHPAKVYNTVKQWVTELRATGTTYDDDLIGAALFNAIPSELAATKELLAAKSKLDPEEVYNTLKVHHESTHKPQTKPDSKETDKVLAAGDAKHKYKQKGKGSKYKSDSKFCKLHPNLHNHSTSECTKLKRLVAEVQAGTGTQTGTPGGPDTTTLNITPHTMVIWDMDYETEPQPVEPADTAMAARNDPNQLYISGENEFILDSGATRHIVSSTRHLIDVKGVVPFPMLAAAHKVITINKVGSVKLSTTALLNNVCLMPAGNANLISLSRVIDSGCKVVFSKETAIVTLNGETLLHFKRKNGLYVYTIRSGDDDDQSDIADVQRVKNKTVIPKKVTAVTTSTARQVLHNARDSRRNANTSSTPSTTSAISSSAVPSAQAMSEHAHAITDRVLAVASANAELLHMRYGHQSCHPLPNCVDCLMAKAKRKPVNQQKPAVFNATAIGERLHIDVVGPVSATIDGTRTRIATMGGNIYALVIVDEKSRYTWVYLLERKSDAAKHIIELCNSFHSAYGVSVRELHSDSGGEFINTQSKQYCSANGIKHTTTTANSPFHNGVVERMNGVLLNITKTNMHHSSAPLNLWGEALTYAAFIHNLTELKHLESRTPYEVLHQSAPYLSNKLRIFGSDAFVVRVKRAKLDSTSIKGIFIGYQPNSNAYRVLDPTTNRVHITRDVYLIENSFSHMEVLHSPSTIEQSDKLIDSITTSAHIEVYEFDAEPSIIINDNVVNNSVHDCDFELEDLSLPPQPGNDNLHSEQLPPIEEETEPLLSIEDFSTTTTTNSGRQSIPPTRYGYIDYNDLLPGDRLALGLAVTDDLSHMTYKTAMNSPESKEWDASMKEELQSLKEQQVSTVVPLPPDVKPLTCRWLFKVKYDKNNKPIRYKSRVVAQGYKQVAGVDFDETYAPVARLQSIRMLLSIAAHHDLELKQLDFKTAFLNATLDTPIYMKIPPGVDHNPGDVWLLHKALYGLKQSPLQWNTEIDTYLQSIGYKSLLTDRCIYIRYIQDKFIILALYVDDTIAAYHHSIENDWLTDKASISNKYPIEDLGDCVWILNMNLTRDRTKSTIQLTQSAYVDKMLLAYDMINCDSIPNPCPTSVLTVATGTSEPRSSPPATEAQHNVYRSMVGSLLYAANNTRPDIAYAVNVLARQVAAPLQLHFNAAKHVLRYLAGTRHLGLTFKPQTKLKIVNTVGGHQLKLDTPYVVYADSSYANDLSDRKSTSGMVVTLYGNVVHWFSHKQSTVTQSTTEAEYIALAEGTKECLYIKQWLHELLNIHSPVTLLSDSQSAIAMVINNSQHQRTKHIDVRHHFIRDCLHKDEIRLYWIPTHQQLADSFTKSLPTPALIVQRNKLLLGTDDSNTTLETTGNNNDKALLASTALSLWGDVRSNQT